MHVKYQKYFSLFSHFILLLGLTLPLAAEQTWDSERLNLEVRMQQRVEEALSRVLLQGRFVVVVRVEPLNPVAAAPANTNSSSGGEYLPGVPSRPTMDGTGEKVQALVDSLKTDKSFQRFIRRISATLVLDQELPDDTVSKVRELTRQILGLDPSRGDTLDIQRTVFQRPETIKENNSTMSRFQRVLKDYWILVGLGVVILFIIVFLLFVFGPLQIFLNRFVQTMAMMKPVDSGDGKASRFGSGVDPQILPALMAQSMGYLPPPMAGNMSPASFSGSLQVENPMKRTMPFGFIREDHLGNLAILLARETPERAAIVLGYLPPDWISRVLAKMSGGLQSEITDHLATTRQLLPEQVEDIEQELKRRLDYMVGGPDRIIAIMSPLTQKPNDACWTIYAKHALTSPMNFAREPCCLKTWKNLSPPHSKRY
jgi:FliG middle domain